MEFYGIEMKGGFYLEKFEILPEFSENDSGRLIYLEPSEDFYYGGIDKWIKVGENLSSTFQEVVDGVVGKKFISPLRMRELRSTILEMQEGIDNVKYVTPSGVRSLKSNNFEVLTGTDDTKYVTPAGLRHIKATILESQTGTDDTKYVTPAGLKNWGDNNPGILPGTIIYYSAGSPPNGYLKANGAAISRTTYSALFSVIGTYYGGGDGSTTFNIPDLRGQFLRSWDDGRGIDPGRVFGTQQLGTLVGGYDDNDGDANVGVLPSRASLSYGSDPVEITQYGLGHVVWASNTRRQVYPAAYASSWYSVTRPRNIALLACIKY